MDSSMFFKIKFSFFFPVFYLFVAVSCRTNQQNLIPEIPPVAAAEHLYPAGSSYNDKIQILTERIKSAPDTLTADGTTYFVSNNGNDNNNGVSSGTPWVTLNKVNNFSFKAGDVVLFERGGIFRGQLRPKSNVSYGAYGTGGKPCIYGSSNNYANSRWTSLGNNIWVCPEQFMTDVGIMVFNNGENAGVKELSVSSLSENFHFFHNRTDNRVYLYYDGSSPSTSLNSIEIGEDRHIIYIPNNGSNITIENLCLKYGGAHGIYGDGIKNVIIRGCELGWIGGSMHVEGERYGNGIENWENADNFTIEFCHLYQIYDAALSHQGTKAAKMNNIVFRNNIIEYCTYSIEYFQRDANGIMSNILYDGNIMRFAGYGWGHQRPDKEEAAHIKSWNHPNKSVNFIIKNNILDTSRYDLFNIRSRSGDMYLPTVDSNIYIQQSNGNAGYWGKSRLRLDEGSAFNLGIMDKNYEIFLFHNSHDEL